MWFWLLYFQSPAVNGFQTPLSQCDTIYQEKGGDAAGECFWDWAAETGRWTEAMNGLKEMTVKYPRDAWLVFYQAYFQAVLKDSAALDTYERAAQLARAEANYSCEIWARVNLFEANLNRDNQQETARQIHLLDEAAQRSQNPKLETMVGFSKVRYLIELEGDLDNAERLLAEIKAFALREEGSASLRWKWYLHSGLIAFRRGDFNKASSLWQGYEKEVKLHGGPRDQASASYNLLNCDIRRLPPTPENRADLILRARAGLKAAVGVAQDRHRYILGKLIKGEEGRAFLEQGLAQVRATEPENVLWQVAYLGALAAHVLAADPQRAEILLHEASTLMASSKLQFLGAINWDERLTVNWQIYPHDKALTESLQILDYTEAIGKSGTGDMTRGEMLSAWTDVYYWLAGHLLQTKHSSDLEMAFSVIERLRARALLEAIWRAESGPARGTTASAIQLRAEIAAQQKKLFNPNLDPQTRVSELAELEKLELRERVEANQNGAEAGTMADLVRPDFASLKRIQASLGADEAMLSFQLEYERNMYDDFAGGSWLWVITVNALKVIPLPDRMNVEQGLDTYLGLYEQGSSPLLAEVGSKLYQRLLQEGMSQLPPGLKRLIIIPDGMLHGLPFAALRPKTDAEPLGQRYQITVVPSATLWLHWRNQNLPAATAALIFADPSRSNAQDAQAGSALIEGFGELEPLPFARREGRKVGQQWGGPSLVLEGEEASEARLKRVSLAEFSTLHFAAHALVDQLHSDRSAVILAAGSAEEDGLLQPREIADLDLRGKMVVLSTCRSASGRTLRGEGVLSLARAFVRAGAHTVVATLWPLRDDQAAVFFASYYHELAQGASTGEALHRAQCQLIAAGAHERDWAGVVLMGDGAYVPFPKGASLARFPKGTLSVALLVGLLVLALATWGWRRSAQARSHR